MASEDQYENVESLRMMTKVSHLYHSKSMVQTDIAKKLGLSQARVSRLLSSAEERGIVRRIVVPPAGLFSELERQIEEKFGICGAEVRYVLENEQVKTADDLLRRRLPIAMCRSASEIAQNIKLNQLLPYAASTSPKELA